MAKRVKASKPDPIRIDSWEGADQILRKIGDLEMNVTAAEANAKAREDEIKEALVKLTTPLKKEIKHLTASLQAFAVSRKEEFKTKRSRELSFGILGWRKSTLISIKKDVTVELIKKMFSRAKAKTLLIIKESPDKNALSKLKDEQLASVEARRKVKDVFFVEPAIPEAVDYNDGE